MYRIHIGNSVSEPNDTMSKILQVENIAQYNLKEIQKTKVQQEEFEKILQLIKNKSIQLGKESKTFTFEQFTEWLQRLPEPNKTPAGLAMQNFQMTCIDRDPLKVQILEDRCYDISLSPVIPCNQYFSGRCWMFAGLNLLRPYFIMKYNLGPDFELSQAYLFFWHYLEQYESVMNLFYYEEMSEEEKQMRL
jgi:hypothetical protein